MLLNIAKENYDEARELRALFEKQLKELYWSEGVMLPMLSNMINDAASKDLIAALESHRVQTIGHISRLEKLFDVIGIEAKALQYDAVQCLMQEAKNITLSARHGVVRDAAIISVLQKVKHFEIACYGTMRAYAIALREEDAVLLLENTLKEEKEADLALSQIAESHINIEAADKEI